MWSPLHVKKFFAFPGGTAHRMDQQEAGSEDVLKGNMEERAERLALYIIENRTTVRAAAQKFGISKSTVHKDISERLPQFNGALYRQVKEVLDISESTLYPVLRRLQAEGCLSAYNRAYRNRNRRYYAITEAGRVRLAENRALWRAYCEGVDWLLREEAKNGEA